MSKVKITGHASGSGTLTLSAPNTSSDRTITLPDETGTVALGVGISDSADATAITIDSSENVGIGVVPESWSSVYSALQIGGTGVLFSNTDVGTGKSMYITQNAYNDGSWKYLTTDEAARYQSVNGTHKFSVAASGTADAAISFTTALEITNDGRGLSEFTARAWVNFDGTGTIAIRESHNVSSLTDNGTGNYDVNFTNAMANTSYATVANAFSDSYDNEKCTSTSDATGNALIDNRRTSTGYGVDNDEINLIVFKE